MRARNVKPGFFQNEEVAELPPETRLLFVGLWLMADREGRLEDRPKRIKMQVFPADSWDVEPMLAALHDSGLIVRYEVAGNQYIEIPKFLDHQRPHHQEKESVIPPRCEVVRTKERSTSDEGTSLSALNPDSLNPDSLNPESTRLNGARVPSRHIDLVFKHWQEVHGHPEAKPSEKRRRLISQRLKEYTLEELREAISGYALSPFHMGDNDNGRKYDSLELILRDAKQVEQGMQFARSPPTKPAGGQRKTKFEQIFGSDDG